MTELEVHPEIHLSEPRRHAAYCTCRACHRSFRPKCEDQLSLELCAPCFDAFCHRGERIRNVHVKARPHRSATR
jgi:uncharacterized UBP type Zn finger protein